MPGHMRGRCAHELVEALRDFHSCSSKSMPHKKVDTGVKQPGAPSPSNKRNASRCLGAKWVSVICTKLTDVYPIHPVAGRLDTKGTAPGHGDLSKSPRLRNKWAFHPPSCTPFPTHLSTSAASTKKSATSVRDMVHDHGTRSSPALLM